MRLPLDAHQALLAQLRLRAGILASTPAMNIGSQADVALAMNVWQHVTSNSQLLTSTCPPSNAPPPYMSKFNHLLLLWAIFSEMRYKAERDGDPVKRDENAVFSDLAMKRLQRFVQDDFGKTHPDNARKIAWEMKLTFIPANDKDLPPGFPSPAANPAFYGFTS